MREVSNGRDLAEVVHFAASSVGWGRAFGSTSGGGKTAGGHRGGSS